MARHTSHTSPINTSTNVAFPVLTEEAWKIRSARYTDISRIRLSLWRNRLFILSAPSNVRLKRKHTKSRDSFQLGVSLSVKRSWIIVNPRLSNPPTRTSSNEFNNILTTVPCQCNRYYFFENHFWIVDFSVTNSLFIRVRPGRHRILLKPTYSLTVAPPLSVNASSQHNAIIFCHVSVVSSTWSVLFHWVGDCESCSRLQFPYPRTRLWFNFPEIRNKWWCIGAPRVMLSGGALTMNFIDPLHKLYTPSPQNP